MKRRYIYGLFDSGELRTIEYIGCTTEPGKRFDTHVRANDKATREWVKSVLAEKRHVRMVILEAARNARALERERWWIGYLRPRLNLIHTDPRYYAPKIQGCKPYFFWKDGPEYFSTVTEAAVFFGSSASSIKRYLKENDTFYSSRFQKMIKLEDLENFYTPKPEPDTAQQSPPTI